MENKTKIDLKNKIIFITGVAGFIGSNLAKRLLSTVEGVKVVGLDNMNHYYDVRLKEARLKEIWLCRREMGSGIRILHQDAVFEMPKDYSVLFLFAQVQKKTLAFFSGTLPAHFSCSHGSTPVESPQLFQVSFGVLAYTT